MADPKIDVKTLGHTGVIVDRQPLDPSIPDDALRAAQNATHDPSLEYSGGIRKRPGLQKFNQVAMAGAILGGIPMAVAGTGGAPATSASSTVDDGTGAAAGGGDGTGAPGATTNGASTPAFDPGAGAFTGSQLFNGARLIAIGFADNTGGAGLNGHGWWLTSAKFNDSASRILSPGPPQQSAQLLQTIALTVDAVYNPADGFLYYVKAQSQTNDGTPTAGSIRKTNGAQDLFVGTIPLNLLTTATHRTLSVQNMTLGSDGNIYFVVVDNVIDATNGRLMKCSLPSGTVSEMVNGVPSGSGAPGLYADFPQSCAYHEGKFFWGTAKRANDTGATINCLSTDQKSIGGVDFNPGADQRFVNITQMVELGGILYALTGQKSAGTAQQAVLLVRQPNAAIGGASTWSSVNANVTSDTPANNNFYCSIVLFNGQLYFSHYDTNIARIYQATPGINAGVYTILNTTSVYNSSGLTNLVPFQLFVDNGVLYAFGSTGASGRNAFLYTTDGVTWVDKGSNFGQANAEFPIQVAFGFPQ